MSVFGPIVSGAAVDEAVLATLRLWLPAYLHEVSAQAGLDEDQEPTHPRTYAARVDDASWQEDRLPVVVVTTRGIPSDGIEDGGGGARGAWFETTITAFVNERGADIARRSAQLYAAAARSALVQHPSLLGFAQAVEWRGEGYDLVSSEDDARTLAGGQVVMGVFLAEVVNRFGGPASPPPDPHAVGSDDPTVTSHIETVAPKPPQEEL